MKKSKKEGKKDCLWYMLYKGASFQFMDFPVSSRYLQLSSYTQILNDSWSYCQEDVSGELPTLAFVKKKNQNGDKNSYKLFIQMIV